MIVSLWSFIVMIVSAVFVIVMPFASFFIGRKDQKKIRMFLWGMLAFLVSIIVQAILWSILHLDSVIPALLGTDSTVDTINVTVKSIFAIAVETIIMFFACRFFMKKEGHFGRPLRFAGGYVFVDSIYVILMLVLSVVVVIAAMHDKELSFHLARGITVSNSTVEKSEMWQYFFKAYVRIMDLISYSVMAFVIYTGFYFDLKWLYIIAAFLRFCMDMPYKLCSLETVWYWRSIKFTGIVMLLVAVITLAVAILIYRTSYREKNVKEIKQKEIKEE